MSRPFPLVIILAGLLLSPCWTRAESKSEASPITIVSFGDSTTALRKLPGGGDLKTYSHVLQEELPRMGIPVKVVNSGIPGHTTADAMKRFEKDVLTHKPDIVIIQFGLNDGSVEVYRDPNAKNPRVSVADYRENLERMIESLKQRGVHVILMSFNPMRWTPKLREMYGKPPYKRDDPDGFNVPLQDFLKTVRDIAKKEQVSFLDVYAMCEKFHKESGRPMDALFLDGVHPNDEGQRMVANLILGEIKKLKEQGECRANSPNVLGWKNSGPDVFIHPKATDIGHQSSYESVMGAALVRLQDGSVINVFSAPRHYRTPVGTTYIASRTTRDGGKTWSDEHFITKHEDCNATHATIVQAGNGHLHVFYLGFKKFEWKDGSPTENCISDLWTIRSEDGGKTWGHRQKIFSGYSGSTNGGVETSRGELIVPFSQYVSNPGHLVSRTVNSTDGGNTWKLSNPIDIGGKGDHDGAVEPCVLELKDGRTWMLIRTSKGVFWESFSTDGGLNWSTAQPTKIAAAHAPAHLIRLQNGRILMVWNPQFTGRRELHLAVSTDEGKSWSRSVPVVMGKQVTYPYLLEKEPGEIWLGLFDVHEDWNHPKLRVLSLRLQDLGLAGK